MRSPGLIAVLAVLVWAGCSEETPLAEVLEDPAAYEGKKVRVRGWSRISISSTLAWCPPEICDCNRVSAALFLIPERETAAASAGLGVLPLTCTGGDCELTCSPFDPTSAEAFELVGTLRRAPSDGNPFRSMSAWWLDELDLRESSALSGGADLEGMSATPLSEGTFTVPTRR